MANRFTRGPWERGIGDEPRIYANGLHVATAYGTLDLPAYEPATEEEYNRCIEEIEANADLIAAAPELLAAVERWVILWTRYGLGTNTAYPMVTEEHRDILESAKIALVKATGTVKI